MTPPSPLKSDAEAPIHDVQDLTAGQGVARLLHRGDVYFLRITRAGKLILTK
jgi:hemin uptake protein HemP